MKIALIRKDTLPFYFRLAVLAGVNPAG